MPIQHIHDTSYYHDYILICNQETTSLENHLNHLLDVLRSGTSIEITSDILSTAFGMLPIGVVKSETCTWWISISTCPKTHDTDVLSCILILASWPDKWDRRRRNLSRKKVLCSCFVTDELFIVVLILKKKKKLMYIVHEIKIKVTNNVLLSWLLGLITWGHNKMSFICFFLNQLFIFNINYLFLTSIQIKIHCCDMLHFSQKWRVYMYISYWKLTADFDEIALIKSILMLYDSKKNCICYMYMYKMYHVSNVVNVVQKHIWFPYNFLSLNGWISIKFYQNVHCQNNFDFGGYIYGINS